MTGSGFEGIMKEDDHWIGSTIGVSGTSWSLLERRLSKAEYDQRTTYNEDSLITWITGRHFSKDEKGDKENKWELPRFIDCSNLLNMSNEKHRLLLGDSAPVDYLPKWDERNVHDFLYSNIVNHPGRTVADIGAGYGRNSFLFVEHGFTYICVDGIEASYMLQHYVLNKLFGDKVVDYLENRELTQGDVASLLKREEPVIIHNIRWMFYRLNRREARTR